MLFHGCSLPLLIGTEMPTRAAFCDHMPRQGPYHCAQGDNAWSPGSVVIHRAVNRTMHNAQRARISNTCRNLRKSRPTWTLWPFLLFPPILSQQSSSLNPLTYRTTWRIKPLLRTWLSTQSVNKYTKCLAWERSLKVSLPICKCWGEKQGVRYVCRETSSI